MVCALTHTVGTVTVYYAMGNASKNAIYLVAVYSRIHWAIGTNYLRNTLFLPFLCVVRWLWWANTTRQQRGIAFLVGRVATAGSVLKPSAVNYCEPPSLVLNQASFLQCASSGGNTCAAHPQHVGQKFLRNDKSVGR